MGGGLLQLVTYGTQDLYLTGNPEITFFKVVYRRYTNFAIENIKLTFDDTVHFGDDVSITIPKNGDMIHRMHVEFNIPEVYLKRNGSLTATTELSELNSALSDYQLFVDFNHFNGEMYRNAKEVYETVNSTVEDMKSAVTEIQVNNDDDLDRNVVTSTLAKTIALLDDNDFIAIANIYIKDIADNYEGDSKDTLYYLISNAKNHMVNLQKTLWNNVLSKREAYNDASNPYIKFAWVEKLGYALIDRIEVEIGGRVIDRHYGDWLNIWSELTTKKNQEENHNKLIGNIPDLTTFDRNKKLSTKIKVPLQFWFCRHNGLALPLVAMQYHNVTIRMKVRHLEDVAYIEDGRKAKIDGINDEFNLRDLDEEQLLTLDATLNVDYVFLDSNERKRFAQSSHEYLIEQIQIEENYNNISSSEFSTHLNFVHPCKELIWIVQKESFRTNNDDGSQKTQFFNYSISTNNKGNSIEKAQLFFHGYERTALLSGTYFNYVQPFEHHTRTPSDGINSYSFALMPEEYQPTGTANFGRLSDVLLKLVINQSMVSDSTVTVRIYAINYNILRIVGGMTSLAYTIR